MGKSKRPDRTEPAGSSLLATDKSTDSTGTGRLPTVLRRLWTYGLPLVAIAVSWQACVVSQRARRDARVVSGLDLTPRIDLHPSFAVEPKPPSITVCNPGPLDLAQLEVNVIRHYHKEGRPGIYSASGTGDDFTIGDLKVFECETHPLRQENVDPKSPLVHMPPEYTAIEFRSYYRHPISKVRFRASAYYFYADEGQWLREDDQRIDAQARSEIVSGSSDTRLWDFPPAPLHIQRDVERESGAF